MNISRRIAPGATIFASALLAVSNLVLAADTPLAGGAGGEFFRLTCLDGSFLIGVQGSAGARIDRVAPICAPWDARRAVLGQAAVSIPFGGPGGTQLAIVCPPGAAVSGWEIGETRSRDPKTVEFFVLQCRAVLSPHAVVDVGRLLFGNQAPTNDGSGPFGSTPQQLNCPDGELAIGFRGASGVYIDRLGLVCSAAPTRPSMRALTLKRERGNLQSPQ